MKYLISTYFAMFVLFSTVAFAECQATTSCNTKDDPLGYSCYDKGQYSYECNVENLCLGQRYGGDYWNFSTDKQLIVTHDMSKYPNLGKTKALSFDDVRKIYEDTQNNIMNCAILKSKYALHKTIIEGYDISEKAKGVLEKANGVIEGQIKEQKCIEPRDGDKIYSYKDLLDSMTYEQCGYNMYLYYYEQNAKKNIGILGAGKTIYSVSEASDVQKTEQNKISEEYELSRRSMDTALTLYENFEKTYPAHILLEMIEVELTEDKRYMGGVVKVVQQLVSLMKNAQTTQGKR